MQLYYIRHGQSANNLLLETTGSNDGRSEDPEITPRGRRQAEVLARFLNKQVPIGNASIDRQNVTGFGITHVYTSLMVRSVATACIVAQELGLRPIALEELHEGGGIYLDDPSTGQKIGRPGKGREYFQSHYPRLVLPDGLGDEGWWNRPFEEYEEMFPRAERFLAGLLARHGAADDHVAVISHAGFYDVLVRTIFKVGRQAAWFGLSNTAITRIDYVREEFGLVYSNRVDFLTGDLLT
jgi:2,3-bisphosphoglycerate-dependent phosphoglycerate mutase